MSTSKRYKENFEKIDVTKDYLLDDESLTNQERFELYYDEHRRVQKQKERKKSKPLNKMLKDLDDNFDVFDNYFLLRQKVI